MKRDSAHPSTLTVRFRDMSATLSGPMIPETTGMLAQRVAALFGLTENVGCTLADRDTREVIHYSEPCPVEGDYDLIEMGGYV